MRTMKILLGMLLLLAGCANIQALPEPTYESCFKPASEQSVNEKSFCERRNRG